MKFDRPNRDSATLVRKLWQYCNVLRDDGLSYPDYVEQLTYLLFLKMSDERPGGPVPAEYGWKSLLAYDAEAMHSQYTHILEKLGTMEGMLGLIFRNARNKIRDPAKLHLLIVGLVGQTEWSGLDADVKGDAYEGLLEKNARDTKSGAGQYFTPRPLIEAMVECINPRLGEVVCDPACGTAGFLLAALHHLRNANPEVSAEQEVQLRTRSLRGVELVEEVARLATMNLLLHGIGGGQDEEWPITCKDSLREKPLSLVDVVLTNPPFGTRGSVTYSPGQQTQPGESTLTVKRPDFWVQTANKQLNFLQHVVSLLVPGGRAAVVVPDNVLFESGAASTIRRNLLSTCRVIALLRLPSGIFYAQGVKSNVLFFERMQENVERRLPGQVWVYDLRSNMRFSLKTKPLGKSDLSEFVQLYKSVCHNSGDKGYLLSNRFRAFDIGDILESKDCRLDLAWEARGTWQPSEGLERLDELSEQISEDLQRALELITRLRQ